MPFPAFLSWCAETKECALGGGDPESTFQTLMSDIDQHPLAAEGRIMGPGETVYGVVMGLYDRNWWPDLAAALTAAESGETAPLLTLSDRYLGRSESGAYDNLAEANLAIMCIDDPWPSVDEVKELTQEADERFPNFGAFNLNITLPCSMWPVEPVSRPEIVHAAGAPPIMVIGTTDDPATPYEWATTLAEQMESATLVTLEGEGHVAMGRGNPCIDEAVDHYLTGLVLPEDGKRCEETSGVSAQGFNSLVPRKRSPLPWR